MKFVYDESINYLTEMSLSKGVISLAIYNASETIREHLMMIYLYNSSTNNHWMNEIHGALHSIAKCKSNNKFLSANEILDNLLYSWEDSYEMLIDDYICEIIEKEHKPINKEFDKNDLLEFIEDYCFWLADRLSKFGFVTSGEIKNEINFLLNARTV